MSIAGARTGDGRSREVRVCLARTAPVLPPKGQHLHQRCQSRRIVAPAQAVGIPPPLRGPPGISPPPRPPPHLPRPPGTRCSGTRGRPAACRRWRRLWGTASSSSSRQAAVHLCRPGLQDLSLHGRRRKRWGHWLDSSEGAGAGLMAAAARRRDRRRHRQNRPHLEALTRYGNNGRDLVQVSAT